MANEKRLIDANALKRKLYLVTLYVPWLRFGKTAISKILESYRLAVFEEIDKAPTIEDVEMVRCKDCKHYNDFFGCMDCQLEIGLHLPGPNGFCHYGERKGDGE